MPKVVFFYKNRSSFTKIDRMFYLPMPKCISLRDDMFARKGKAINDIPALEEEKEYEMFVLCKSIGPLGPY